MMGRINLLSGFLVRDIPKVARDYLYRLFYPIARRRNLFVIEYPSLFNECRVFFHIAFILAMRGVWIRNRTGEIVFKSRRDV